MKKVLGSRKKRKKFDDLGHNLRFPMFDCQMNFPSSDDEQIEFVEKKLCLIFIVF